MYHRHTHHIALFTTTDFPLTFSYEQLLPEQTLFRSVLAFQLLSAQYNLYITIVFSFALLTFFTKDLIRYLLYTPL